MLHQTESKILSVLHGRMSAQEIAQKARIPEGAVLSFAESLKEKGLVKLTRQDTEKILLTADGKRYLKEGFPEQRVAEAARLSKPLLYLSPEQKSIGLPWAIKNKWVAVENGVLKLKLIEEIYRLKSLLEEIADGKEIRMDDLALFERRKLTTRSIAKIVYLEPALGAKKHAQPAGGSEINQLTREMLLSGSWKSAALRGYDVSAPSEIPSPAKRHMVSRLRKRISRIFTDMGFEEMEGDEAQSSFWNFDALFQPQDHPARDLADTFYLKQGMPLPKDGELVGKVKAVHEKCWGGKWGEKNAEKAVLRTHTTALSARYLYEQCQGKIPKKYFAIGKVFRNEATDYKHLAEFFQVEGIVVWEGATFRDLLGCLKEFYRKLGFSKIRFEPSYFPYTEPSLQVTVYFDKKKQWLELGGAGIFRPEVSIPLCGRYPVLAWGLSLERPLMLLNEMDDIRTFYRSNVGWIRKQKL